jgi:multidrug resistance efflux pump
VIRNGIDVSALTERAWSRAQARARLGVPLDGSGDGVEVGRTALVRQARAVLEQQRANRERLLGLHREGILARAELDAAEAEFRVAEARYQEALEEVHNRAALLAERRTQLRIAQQQLADATLRAPFDGACSSGVLRCPPAHRSCLLLRGPNSMNEPDL